MMTPAGYMARGYSMAQGDVQSARTMAFVDRSQAQARINALASENAALRQQLAAALTNLQATQSKLSEWVGYADSLKKRNDETANFCMRQQLEIERLTGIVI